MKQLLSGDIKRRSLLSWSARRHAGFLLRHLTPRKLANALRCVREMQERRPVLESHPIYLRVCVSELCNLRCPGCLLGQGAMPTGPGRVRLMDFDVFTAAVRDFLPHVVEVNLYDEGEPLLNPAVFRMTRYLREHHVGSCISTNFSMTLTDDRLHALADSGLDHLIVCVDGATQETYEHYRRGGDLALVLSNLRRLMALEGARGRDRLRVEIQFVEFDHNRHEQQQVAALARELGVWRFVVIQGSSPIGWRGTDFTGTEAERRRRGCYQLWVSAHIGCDGSLWSCDYGEDHGIASVGWARDYLAAGLRNHPRLVELRRSFGPQRTALHADCRTCSLYRRS